MKYLPNWLTLLITSLWFLGPRICNMALWRFGSNGAPKPIAKWKIRCAVKRWAGK